MPSPVVNASGVAFSVDLVNYAYPFPQEIQFNYTLMDADKPLQVRQDSTSVPSSSLFFLLCFFFLLSFFLFFFFFFYINERGRERKEYRSPHVTSRQCSPVQKPTNGYVAPEYTHSIQSGTVQPALFPVTTAGMSVLLSAATTGGPFK